MSEHTAPDIHGKAILDYLYDEDIKTLYVHNHYGDKEEMPIEVFFREWEDLNLLERKAVELAQGKILDVGAGAGAISLILQDKGKDVTALELSPGCVQAMKILEVKQGIEGDIYHMSMQNYDTILLLMNGIGLPGRIAQMETFLDHLFSLMNPGGQILFDSSDISYLYDSKPMPDHYFGELDFRFEYKGAKGEWFPWLYIDPETMKEWCLDKGFHFEVLLSDGTDSYLGRITKP